MDLVMDLGTAFFRIAVSGTNKILKEPNVIARDRSGRVIIGRDAAKMVGRNPDVIELTHPVIDGVIRDVDAVVAIIRHSVKSFMPSGLARRFNLTMAIASGLTPVEEKVVEDAARFAGARHVQLVNSTVAAALGAGLPIDKPTGSLVVNLGAGVTEAAVLSMRGVVESQRLRFGGRTIDDGIIEKVRKQYSFLLGQKTAEELKHRFSHEPAVTQMSVRGRNLRTGLPGELSVPRSLLDEQLQEYCESITDLIVQTISTCPPELVGDITEQGIVLVGGGSQVAGLLEKLRNRLEVPIIIAEEPDTSVIRGLVARPWGYTVKANKWSSFSVAEGFKTAQRVLASAGNSKGAQKGNERNSG